MTRRAVLFSAGLDSAVLLLHAAKQPGAVLPVYVSAGLAWEAAERALGERFLASVPATAGVLPMTALAVDMRDVYPAGHWAVRGAAPAFDSPDADVYLMGRNVVLLSKAAVFAAQAGCSQLLLGLLAGNPFPDARPAFFTAMARALSLGLDTPIEIEAPFKDLSKADVIRLGATLNVPFELTLSCMQPAREIHCGQCSKCRERRDGFREAGVEDPTVYAVAPRR